MANKVYIVLLQIFSDTYLLIAGADFTAGRYTATFTSGATTATASIPIIADDIDEPTEQFSLRLYIDGDGYDRGLKKGTVSTTIVTIGMYIHIFLLASS